MSLENNDSFVEITIEELPETDCDYTLLQKLARHLRASVVGPLSAAAISICRGEFSSIFVGSYCIKEDGNGRTEGLFKRVEGLPTQITLPLPREIKVIKGDGATELIPPKGWKISDDPEIQNKYNIGTAPNFKAAAIEYIGV